MIIALTGTPGTGKTSVAGELPYNFIDLTEFVKQRGLGEKGEKEFEADIDAMVEELEKEVGDKDIVIEGHFAHHFPADYCIVLRCEPEELEKRLSERDYSREKIDENVEAEALDVILQESVKKQESIIEIDTTDREAADVAVEIERRIKGDDTGYGSVDWTGYF